MKPNFQQKEIYHYFNVIQKRWPICLIIFTIIIATNLFLNLRKDYVYQATAKITIGGNIGQQTLGNSFDSYHFYVFEKQEFATHPYVLKSKPVLTNIATRLNWIDPEKNPEEFKALMGQISSSISIQRIQESRLFNINANHTDPEKAQQLSNITTDVFIERNMEKKLNSFKKSIAWLSDQLLDLEYSLEDSQKNLIKYIEQERVTSFGDKALLPQPLIDDQKTVESQMLIQRLHTQIVENELELEGLLRKYTKKHPKVIQTQETLKLTRAKPSNESRRSQVKDQKRESEAIRNKQKEIKYSILKRKVDINKELYNSLIQKMKELDIASAINDSNIDVLEYAPLPSSPIYPRKGRQILLGILIAFGLALGFPILMDHLDPTLKSSEEVENFLKLPILTSIPNFSSNGNGTEHPNFPVLNTNSVIAEAFRILKLNIQFAFPAKSGKTLIITSSGPHEGKSTVAANLALTMANAGLKTCLVDSDLRVPRIHKIFDLPNQKGLTNYLVGETTNLDEIMANEKSENLFVITSGIHSPKPAELLETEVMQNLIKQLREKFDCVIFDSPPAGNIVDPSILSSYLDGTIFVLQSGKVNKTHIRTAKSQLDRVNANICGVVFNKVETPKNYSYYYYYHSNEKKGEETADDSSEKEKISA